MDRALDILTGLVLFKGMKLNNTQLGFLRAFGVAVLCFGLSWLGDTAHLSGVVSDSIAAFISMIALAIEHNIESNTDKALFGTTKVVRY